MHVHLTRLNDAVHFRAVTPHSTVDMDGSAKVGGEGKGPLPTELVIAALGGCTGIDVVDILRKQKLTITSFEITLSATRQQDVVPSLFETIHVKFILDGNIKPEHARRAVALSFDKYCTVAKILEKSAVISHSIVLNGKEI